MISKYGISNKGPLVLIKPRESGIWKGIVLSSELLRSGLCWKIGNGKRALFWLDESTLLEQCVQQLNNEHRDLTVEDYWLTGSGWDWSVLSASL